MKYRFFKDIPVDKIAQWSFFVFLLAAPLSLRKIVWWIPIRGGFNEYAEASVYLSDIALGVCLGASFLLIYNKLINKSIQRENFLKLFTARGLPVVLIVTLPSMLILWALVSLQHTLMIPVGVFSVIKLLEWHFLSLLIVAWIVSHGTTRYVSQMKIFQRMLQGLIIIGATQAFLGIIQFVQQKSVGLFLFGESHIIPSAPGVAKIIVANTHLIRAYGTLPHPNILGGLLMASIVATHLYGVLFRVEQERFKKMWRGVVAVQYVGIILAFSKSAILGLIVALVIIKVVPRGMSKYSLGSGFPERSAERNPRNRWAGLGAVGVLVCLGLMFFSQLNKDAFLFQSLRERDVYQSIAFNLIQEYPFLGISCGQMVVFLSQQTIYPLSDWQMQPVHNVFLLIWVELGVVGFFLFTLWVVLLSSFFWGSMDVGPDDVARRYFYAIFFGYMPILLADHYLWDIQQGQILWWTITGTLSGFILRHKIIK